jgi:hypothetical protein
LSGHEAATVFIRDGENYPSGRRYQRVTRIHGQRQVSISLAVDPDGSQELTLSEAAQVSEQLPPIEYGEERLGRRIGGADDFSALRKALADLLEKLEAGRA